jgi:hypothetical protein
LQSLSNQLHDFNVGMGPDVGTVPGGNNFGTRVFWTAVVPEEDVRLGSDAGTVRVHVENVAALDYPEDFSSGSLGPNWRTAYVPATVSFDIDWSRSIDRQVTVRDATDQFAGKFDENHDATVTWSAQSASGFQFHSLPGNRNTSTPGSPNILTTYFFAEVGHERNGIFFPSGSERGDGQHGNADRGGSEQAGARTADIPGPTATAGSAAGVVGSKSALPGRTSLDAVALVAALGGSSAASATAYPPLLPPPRRADGPPATPVGTARPIPPASAPDWLAGKAAHRRVLDQVFPGLEDTTPSDAPRADAGLVWAV